MINIRVCSHSEPLFLKTKKADALTAYHMTLTKLSKLVNYTAGYK